MSIAIYDQPPGPGRHGLRLPDQARRPGGRRTLLEAPEEGLPKFWDELQSVGWLGLHIPRSTADSGYSLPG